MMTYTSASQVLADFNDKKISMKEAQEFMKTLEARKVGGNKRSGFSVTASPKGLVQIMGEAIFFRGRYLYPDEALVMLQPENVAKILHTIMENTDIKCERKPRNEIEADCVTLLEFYEAEKV